MNHVFSIKVKDLITYKSTLFECFQVIAGSLFLALCAQIKIPLFFTPIPITGQTFAVLLLGCMFGPKKGFFSCLAYLTEVFFGLPFLAGGGVLTTALFVQRGGYILAYPLQAYLAGRALEKTRSSAQLLATLYMTCAIQLSLGGIWLAYSIGLAKAFLLGVVPFLPGELAKCLAVVYYSERQRH